MKHKTNDLNMTCEKIWYDMRSIAWLCDDKYTSIRSKVSMTRKVYEQVKYMKQYMNTIYEIST